MRVSKAVPRLTHFIGRGGDVVVEVAALRLRELYIRAGGTIGDPIGTEDPEVFLIIDHLLPKPEVIRAVGYCAFATLEFRAGDDGVARAVLTGCGNDSPHR